LNQTTSESESTYLYIKIVLKLTFVGLIHQTMADDDQFHHSSGNWWDTASRNMRFDHQSGGGTSQSSNSSAITNNNIVDFGWQNSDMVEIKPRSSMENSFHDTQKLQQNQDSSTSSDPNLHMMGLGLSSHSIDWNQPSLM
jgi:hypothetical protein